MKKFTILLYFALMIFSLSANAQDKVKLLGEVYDKATHAKMVGSMVYLLREDSTAIDSLKAELNAWTGTGWTKMPYFYFDNVTVPARYILKVTNKDYDTLYESVDLTNVGREHDIHVPNLYIQRSKVQQLEEFTVVATKVKFYHKGDTLVYNADAFQLSEGSMLDELVRQLPGAELKDDGRIFVNGRFVESLMLNGKDFFRGQNKIMLENLPTYMVKDVKVYEHSSDLNKWAGRELERKNLVMDVNLKKQYNIGWISNMEMGGGTSDRYLARLFALRFTDHSRLTFYANANNTNDSRKPGQDTGWTPEKMPTGLMTNRMAGIDYNFTPRNLPLTLNGNVQIQHLDNNVESYTNRTNFLSGGDTYDRVVKSSRSCDMTLSSSTRMDYRKNRISLTINPDYKFHKYHNKSGSQSATLSEEYSLYGKQWIDSLFTPILSSQLRQRMLNRNMESYKQDGHDWRLNFPTTLVLKIPHTSDFLTLSAALNLYNADNANYSIQRIEYPSGSEATDYRNNYARGSSGRGYEYKFATSYRLSLKENLSLSVKYGYEQNYTFKDKSLYRLDLLSGQNTEEGDIGVLPSRAEYQQAIDYGNSYRSRQWDRYHEGSLSFNWYKRDKGIYLWSVSSMLSIPLHQQKMIYERAVLDTTFTRNKLQVKLFNIFAWNSRDNKQSAHLIHQISPTSPDLSYFANVTDDSNPLIVTHGNAHLKDTYLHSVSLQYSYTDRVKQLNIAPRAAFNYRQNALAMGYVYNRATGRRDITPENVNGNYDLTFALNFSSPLNKNKSLSLNNNLSLTFIHSVDLTGVDGASSAVRSTVMTRQLGDEFTIEKTFGKQKLSFKGSFTNIHSTGSIDNFEAIDAYNYSYGLLGTFKLPWKLELSTDVTMYSRRGYDYEEMNSDDLLWNARLSRPFFKGKFVAMIDAFDILHQLSNVQRYMNAQARTETYVNSLPRYVMFHFIYRLNLNPKKK